MKWLITWLKEKAFAFQIYLASEKGRKETEPLIKKGRYYQSMGSYAKFLACTNQVVRLRPDWIGSYMIRAEAYTELAFQLRQDPEYLRRRAREVSLNAVVHETLKKYGYHQFSPDTEAKKISLDANQAMALAIADTENALELARYQRAKENVIESLLRSLERYKSTAREKDPG